MFTIKSGYQIFILPVEFLFVSKNFVNLFLTFFLVFRVYRKVVQCPRNSLTKKKVTNHLATQSDKK